MATGVSEFITTVLGFVETAGEECLPLAAAVKDLSQWLHEETFDHNHYLALTERIETSLYSIYDANFSVEQLKEESNFIRYIELLQWSSERYCILIASSDTPCGSPLFTRSVGQELCKVGIQTDLSDKFRASYAAIIDGGKTIAERISFTDSVLLEETFEDVHITIKSSWMNVKDSSNGVYIDIQKSNESILDQATDMPTFIRGLLFAVYDKEKNVICDIAGFDTYEPYLTCVRKENKLIKLIEDAYPGITFIKYAAPKFSTDAYSENELYILNHNIDYSLILAYPEIKSAIRDSIKETEGIREVLTPPASYININGARCFEDHIGTYLNTINGHRKTTGQPVKAKRTIYMLLSKLWVDNMQCSENIGAIVMNCNPFTLGHRYLIEQAAKQCEQLLIFAVQEDKSFFPYNDRIELVRQGVQDLPNVSVVGSGKIIISSLTFQSYFNKASLQDRTIDCSDDVTLFVNEIAPAANIKTRFVGEEPLDQVTNQYNRTLEKILPMNGIQFVENPRKTTGDNIISASRVRQLLQDRNWDEIKKYVPETTLRYLEEKYR